MLDSQKSQMQSDIRAFVLWSSSFTRRWHMNAAMSHADDHICAHQGRCGLLVMVLFPDHSPDLLRAAITHDAAEFVVGDLSAPFKQAGGDLVAQHAALEDRIRTAMGFGGVLTDLDQCRLKLVDRLDGFLFVNLRQPSEINRNGWPEVRAWIMQEAETLGIGDVVRGLLWDSDAGACE